MGLTCLLFLEPFYTIQTQMHQTFLGGVYHKYCFYVINVLKIPPTYMPFKRPPSLFDFGHFTYLYGITTLRLSETLEYKLLALHNYLNQSQNSSEMSADQLLCDWLKNCRSLKFPLHVCTFLKLKYQEATTYGHHHRFKSTTTCPISEMKIWL